METTTTDILNLNEVEGGEYICQVSNIAGSENDSVVLTGTEDFSHLHSVQCLS